MVRYNIIKPTVLKIKGYRFFFFSNDMNEPVHIHVESDDNYAKFWLEPVQLAKSVGYNAKELSKIKNMVIENSLIFKRSWNEHFSR
jgi:hypothetical protein